MMIAAVNFDINKIVAYFNIALVVLFIMFALGVAGAIWRGFRRGVWKSTHDMIFMFSLVVIAFVTLDPLCKFVEGFDISIFVKGSFVLSTVAEGETLTYYVPLTSVKETATEFLKGLYTIYNVSATAASATNFAFAIVESVLKILLIIVDILLILTLGNLACFLSWILIGRHFIPKLARKIVKFRWVGAIETAVTFVVMTAIFCMPLTSLANSLSHSYNKNRPNSDNEIVINIGNFVDAYSESLFAKLLFNWSYNEETGMTLDTQLFDKLTTGISGDVSVGLVSELANWTNLLIIGANGITNSETGQVSFNAANLVTQEIAYEAFEVLANSSLLTNVLPIVTEIALNSSVLDSIIPSRLIDLSDVEWKSEIKYMQDMVDSLFESRVLDKVKNAKYDSLQGEDLVDFIESIVKDEHFGEALNVFKSIDESKVLSRVVPAVTYYFISNDTEGKLRQFLPFSWEELNEFSWGYECYVLFDFLSQAINIDDQLIRVLMAQFGAYKPEEGVELPSLASIIANKIDDFNALIVGEFDDAGNPVNVDAKGRTVVFENKKHITGRHYCLFDMQMISKAMPLVMDKLFELDALKSYQDSITEEDKVMFKEAVAALNEGVVVTNYKKEFGAILDITASILKDEELLEAITSGGGFDSLMSEPGNFFSIDSSHIHHFKEAVEKMDKSALLYSAVTPIVKSFLSKEDLTNTLGKLGLRSDVMVSAINQDMQKEEHEFFTALASLLDHWDDLGKIFELTSSAGSDLMAAFADEELVDVLVDLLDIIHDNPIINPTPTPEEAEAHLYVKNENLYGLLDFVFSNTASFGLEVTREQMMKVEDVHPWHDEFVAVGGIIKYIASHDILNASSLFEGGLTRDAITSLKEEGEGKIGLPSLFTLVDKSYLFSTSLGPFLDEMFGGVLSGFLIDENTHTCFSNIVDWKAEGESIGKLLTSLQNIIPEGEGGESIFTNFDVSKLKEIVDLNDMLHQIAHSGVFTYIDNNEVPHYQFGAWFYQKLSTSMAGFKIGANTYDILADPKANIDSTWSWKDSWGIRPGTGENPDSYFVDYETSYPLEEGKPTHYIAYRDFVNINDLGSDSEASQNYWCNYDVFTEKQEAFLEEHQADLEYQAGVAGRRYYDSDNYWNAYFASDLFISDYDDVFAVDEISRVCKFMTYSLRLIEKCETGPYEGSTIPFDKVEVPVLQNLLTSLNDTCCLRVCIYNFYQIATENLLDGYGDFDISSAYTTYMIDADYEIFDFAHARPARQEELDLLINFYDVINKANNNGVISAGSFDYSKLNETGFLDDLKGAFKMLNDSYVFHRKGSSKLNELTPYQKLFDSILSKSSMKDLIYINNSPKDQFNTAAGTYSDSASKVRYLVNETFVVDQTILDEIEGLSLDADAAMTYFTTKRNAQLNEIDGLFNIIESVYSLKTSGGEVATSIGEADLNNADNIDVIEDLLNKLNNNGLLYDCLPNVIYNIFVENTDQLNISGKDGKKVNFSQVDPFYHYYFSGSEVNFEAKYTVSDIGDIVTLLEDYQSLNDQLGEKTLSDPATLKTLTGEGGALKQLLLDLHDSNLFHSPGRNYVGVYYTDKFENGLTLFEEMVNAIFSFTSLDEFAYDSVYDSAYANAEAKMFARIKAMTLADDGIDDSGVVYHKLSVNPEDPKPWRQEIDAVLSLANTASDLGNPGEPLDVSSLQLNLLAPTTIKNMLKAVNSSDIICDALPGFVSSGFDGISLGQLTTYNEVNYAYYRLGQVVYGGLDGAAGAGTEIDNIYQVMTALYDEGTGSYASNINNITSFVEGSEGLAKLEGLLKYIYNSHIFDTNQDGEYHVYNEDASHHKFSAQGIMLYNALGSDVTTYIARDADPNTAAKTQIDKIATLSAIVHMDNYTLAVDGIDTYRVEAQGLKQLLDAVRGNISATTFTDNDVETIKGFKTLFSNLISCSYNADGNSHRSAIVSEFVSGLLNFVMENQYQAIDDGSAGTYAGYEYVAFSFGNDDANDIETYGLAVYSELDEVEKDGVEGVIDSLNYITNGVSLPSLILARDQIAACFAKMGATPGNNSHLAQILYLTQAHPQLARFTAPPNIVRVDTTDPELNNHVYSNTFCFKDYGESFASSILSWL